MSCYSENKSRQKKTIMKEILYILLDRYADHEMVFITQGINADEMGMRKNPKYENKVVAKSMEPVLSCGGFRTLPDYTFETMPKDYEALILVGGYGWLSPEAELVLPCVKEALVNHKIVGAICNAASWMAKQGFLNNIKHTGNGVQQLQMWGGETYTGAAKYLNEQSVADGNIITANGSGYLEFAKNVLNAIENETPDRVEMYYTFNKVGLVKLLSPQPRFRFNTVGIFTRNNKATVDFYTKTFGFTTEWDGIQPNVEMTLGESRIILFPRDAFEEMTGKKYEYPEGFNGTVELSFDVLTFAQVDAEYQNALNNGAKSVLVPTTEPWGQRTCYVSDPDGNLIEISSFVQG